MKLFAYDKVDLIITCKLGMEKIVESYVRDLDVNAQVLSSPQGFPGLVLVAYASDKNKLFEEVKKRIPEVEKVFLVEKICEAKLDGIIECSKSFSERISCEDKFAVSTVRRGRHDFKSMDVNIAVGSELKKLTNAKVDLENPDKVLVVQIINGYAYLSMVSGSEFHRKMKPYKYPMYKVFRKFVIAHEPYLGPIDASYVMGTRIGREVQTYEVGRLIIAPISIVDAQSFYHFLKGLFEGIESRYKIQKRNYGREVHKTQVQIQDMYQFIRSKINQPIIIFEPEGEPISKISGEVADFILENVKSGRNINLMVGAREGIPTGLFRFANYVLDIAPGIVISTDYALASAITAITTILHEKLVQEEDIESIE
ncbi:MAG: SPOUT family RNA methylase [Candidatus Methanomethylicia archaeon]